MLQPPTKTVPEGAKVPVQRVFNTFEVLATKQPNSPNKPSASADGSELKTKPKGCHGDRWITERYRVKPDMKDRILQTFGLAPELDVFADPETKLFSKWWGPGGKVEGAFTQPWGPEKIL